MLGNACRWVRSRLPLLAGDDLVGPERRRVERHLAGCTGCRDRLGSLRAALDVLHAAAPGPLPGESEAAGLWPDLAREIRESRRPMVASRPRRLALPAVAAVLMVGIGVLWSARIDRGVRRMAAMVPVMVPVKAKVPVRRAVERKAVRPAVAPEERQSVALDVPTKRRRPSNVPGDRRVAPPTIH